MRKQEQQKEKEKFLNPERKSCGIKNIRIRVDGDLGFKNFSVHT